jgi:uncharacterized protein (TIGR03086 family)
VFDLGPAAQQMSRLIAGVQDDHLYRATPCTDWTVADLLAHVHQFSSVFTDNARKQPVHPPDRLVDDWRTAIPRQLDDLVQAWRDETAWQGRTSAGGVDMAAADNAVVAIEELVVHGWDLAQATGQDAHVTDASLDEIDKFFELFGPGPAGEGPFGPQVDAPEEATRLQRTIARTGRNPRWDAVS